jgi:hypothetical protein
MSLLLRILCVGLALLAQASAAQDVRYSAFGTIGYARSTDEHRYQRAVDSDGTLARDSLLGAQIDAALTPSSAPPSRPAWRRPATTTRK